MYSRFIIALCAITCLTVRASATGLVGIDGDSGDMFRISTLDASMEKIGSTGLVNTPADLALGIDGNYYTFGGGQSAALIRISPLTYQPTTIGQLGIGFVVEGGMAIAPNGTAYGTSLGTSLFTINLETGEATVIGAITGSTQPINGLAWRSDGKLIGLEQGTGNLFAIDPQTAVSQFITDFTATSGPAGAMAIVDGVGYFNTGGPYPNPGIPGYDTLWRFDPFTGASEKVGPLGPTFVSSRGMIGMTAVPEPELIVIDLLYLAMLSRRRRTPIR